MKYFKLIVLLFVFTGCIKNELQPVYNKSKKEVTIKNYTIPNMKEYENNKEYTKTPLIVKLFISSSKNHYVSLDKKDYIVYKKTEPRFNNDNTKNKEEKYLKYFDECKEILLDNYVLHSCKGKYLDETLTINSIKNNNKKQIESIELSDKFFISLKREIKQNKQLVETIKKRKRNKYIKIFRGIGQGKNLFDKCPEKLYITTYKDFSYNVNGYPFVFDNGSMDMFHFTDFTVYKNEGNALEGEYRTHISDAIQCKGIFRVELVE